MGESRDSAPREVQVTPVPADGEEADGSQRQTGFLADERHRASVLLTPEVIDLMNVKSVEGQICIGTVAGTGTTECGLPRDGDEK